MERHPGRTVTRMPEDAFRIVPREDLVVVDNLCDHMIGNVYVRRARCIRALKGSRSVGDSMSETFRLPNSYLVKG